MKLAVAVWTVVAIGTALPSHVAGQTTRRATRADPMTASIRGTVTAADTGAPVRGAEVRVASTGSYRRLGTTDGDGRFDLSNLPGGEYRLTVSRSGFTSLQYGQRRPLEAAELISLPPGGEFAANLALTRGGAISGHIYDRFGDPIAGTRVQVLRSRMSQGQRRIQSLGSFDRTDDTGAFRIYGLPPGDYFVTASPEVTDPTNREPPAFYPGTSTIAEAIPISLASGGEAVADFQMPAVRNARISGIVLNSSGAPVAAMVRLASEVVVLGPALEAAPPPALMINADSGPDGRFTIDNVPPGPYTLTAQSTFDSGVVAAALTSTRQDLRVRAQEMMRAMASRGPETASMTLAVAGDMSDLTLVTQPSGSITVRYVADTGVVSPLPRNLRVNTRSRDASGVSFMGGSVTSRGGFTMRSPSGPFNLEVDGLPADWVVRAVLVDGVDLTDQPIDLHGRNSEVRIVLSDRGGAITGAVQARADTAGRTVVAFPDDPNRWSYPSRYVRTAKTDDQGRFAITGLPPDERYLVLAVDYLEDGDEQDPQVLEQFRARSTSVTLGEGEQRSVWLDLVER